MSRAWRKVRTDWESWQARDLSGEDIVRLILDGTGVKARLDRRVMSIPLLVAVGVRRDGQKVLLAVKNMGGETEAGWRHVLEDLLARGLKAPELLIESPQRPQLLPGVHAVLPQRQTMKRETAFPDGPLGRGIRIRCRYMDVVSGVLRRQCQRQAMRQEKTRDIRDIQKSRSLVSRRGASGRALKCSG